MKVHVVEYVSYDYYRFDEVLGVALSSKKAAKIAAQYKKTHEYLGDIPVEFEDEGYDMDKYDEREDAHLYISTFDVKRGGINE